MNRPAGALEVIFERLEAGGELVVRLTERGLGLDLELTREIGDREEQIAQLLGSASWIIRERLAQLRRLLVDLVQHVGRTCPVESDSGDARADFVRAQQRG